MIFEFANPLDCTASCKSLEEALPPELKEMSDGLYAFLFENSNSVEIRDKNKNKMVVIQKEARSLKPGKFEHGFLKRFAGYGEHLHYVDNGGKEIQVLPACLKSAYVLDLTKCDVGLKSSARAFERYWVEGIRGFLEGERLMATEQNGRAEWFYLKPHSWTAEMGPKFLAFLGELEDRIRRMMKVGDLGPLFKR